MTHTVNSSILAKAIYFASRVHKNHVDKAGNPYILHPLWVMNEVAKHGNAVMTLAICHDTIEDGFDDINYGMKIFAENVTDDVEIVTSLRLLTKPKNANYMEYIKRIATNEMCRLVKMADLRHNSDITRLKGITEKDLKRVSKYHAAYLYLNGSYDKLLGAVDYE